MEPPQIRFTTTSDGVGIAYWSIGSGPPLLITHNFTLNHAELELTVPSLASFYRTLAEHLTVIRYDVRTAGLSGREPGIDLTTTAMGHDIAAVPDSFGRGDSRRRLGAAAGAWQGVSLRVRG